MLLHQFIVSIVLLLICLVVCVLTEKREHRPASSGSSGSGGSITYQTALGEITDLMGNYRGGSPARKERNARDQIGYIWYPSFVLCVLCGISITYCSIAFVLTAGG